MGVQITAAKAYARELVKVGLLDADFTPTELANRWRQDANDPETINQILRESYPPELLELAPPGEADRDKVVRWFMNEGLGEGAAKNKAATYLMISSGVPDEPEQRVAVPKRPAKRPASQPQTERPTQKPAAEGTSTKGHRTPGKPSLNVNVQIHISADASSEQIDAIFGAMRQYFDESD